MFRRIDLARPSICLVLMLLGVLALAGCSGSDLGPTGTVKGTLQLRGKTLPAGHGVVFMEPKRGFLAYGTTDAAGNFRVDSWNGGKLPVGQYEVSIRPPAPEVDPETIDAATLIDNPEMAKKAKVTVAFAKKYLEPRTSGLAFEVKAGENDFQIDLKD